MSETAKVQLGFGHYPCGEETRQRIIDAAVVFFGRQGFAETSTRDIADAADIKTPAIQYYFGSKLGLYNACIDQLTAAVAQRITPGLEKCRALVMAGSPLDQIFAALCEVQDSLIDSFFDGYEGHAIRRLLAWDDVESSLKASDALMKDRIGRPIFETFHAVVECVMSAPALPSEAEIQTMALMGISMIFHTNHDRVLDLINQPGFSEDFLHTLKQVARRQVTYVLYGLAAPPLPTMP